ncbi:hypothetical protein KC331_g15514 [Hortaea werneckii]|nr:hypothetical protein KC331_g15514 [Hortaea werneckii]
MASTEGEKQEDAPEQNKPEQVEEEGEIADETVSNPVCSTIRLSSSGNSTFAAMLWLQFWTTEEIPPSTAMQHQFQAVTSQARLHLY